MWSCLVQAVGRSPAGLPGRRGAAAGVRCAVQVDAQEAEGTVAAGGVQRWWNCDAGAVVCGVCGWVGRRAGSRLRIGWLALLPSPAYRHGLGHARHACCPDFPRTSQVLEDLGCGRGTTYHLLQQRAAPAALPPSLELAAEELAAARAALAGPVYDTYAKDVPRLLLMRLNEFLLRGADASYVTYDVGPTT